MSDEKKPVFPVTLKDLRSPATEQIKSFREEAERAMASLYPSQELMKSYSEGLPEIARLAKIDASERKSFAAALANLTSSLPGAALSKQLQEMKAQFRLGTNITLPGEEFRKQLKEIGYQNNLSSVISGSLAEQLKKYSDSVLMSSAFADAARSISAFAPVLADYQTSALYGFLSKETANSIKHLERLQAEFDENFQLVDEADLAADLEIRPDLEREIIEVVRGGKSFADLSRAAKKYFLVFWDRLWRVLNASAIVVTLFLAWQSQEASIEQANSPQEIRKSVHCISPEHRTYLRGCAVVTRDEVIVRSESIKKSKELVRLPSKTMVEVLGRASSGWVHVSVHIGDSDISGWISERYLLVY